jgi:hypothetical protein
MKMQLETHIKTICSLSLRLQENCLESAFSLTRPATHDRPLKGLIRVQMSGVVPSKNCLESAFSLTHPPTHDRPLKGLILVRMSVKITVGVLGDF